ncbi:hypothetical protein MAPG_10084 [Magnaporthiopsis poae ATCC 64411]|uniref:NAD(P)-binding domain-containing protein n=1 Tax=Magnaporthiopsis poae (strain ATCC 64411 / 73-15) TaxID=644358 RepID=A0A0C4EBN2_MAGP6|nr:hypothetical protein MAPG_10084 [Magnaporthiopsis poae ATCC 64411]
MSTPKSILFLGATGGVAQTALLSSLAAGHTCVALARSASKLAAALPFPSYPNLTIIEGNARDQATMERALVVPGSSSSPQQRMVDIVVSSVGSLPSLRNGGLLEDSAVCATSMAAMLAAIDVLAARFSPAATPTIPRIVAVSSTGLSRFGRDVPLAFVPLYWVALAAPHRDKEKMERLLVHGPDGKDDDTAVTAAARPEFTIIRGSLYVADDESKREKPVRVGIEDPVKGIESKAIGYTISREAIGRWIFSNLLEDDALSKQYSGKVVTLTY